MVSCSLLLNSSVKRGKSGVLKPNFILSLLFLFLQKEQDLGLLPMLAGSGTVFLPMKGETFKNNCYQLLFIYPSTGESPLTEEACQY